MVQTQIRYITPFALDKNIGKAYNDAISDLPDDCYVVLRDGDTMFLSSDWGNKISAIIGTFGKGFQLITGLTNRISLKDCLYAGIFNENDKIGDHIKIETICWDNHRYEISETDVAPGMLMIFHKSLWLKHKFRENSIIFDRQFSNEVIRSGGKIGVAKGLYIFHLYRFGQENPQSYTKHLKK